MTSPPWPAQAPLSQKTLSLISEKNMDKESPILVRIFKEEAELEVWKMDPRRPVRAAEDLSDLQMVRRSRPKKKEGDRQAPEGFYTITPAQMNPNSNYYLASTPASRTPMTARTVTPLRADGARRLLLARCYAMTDEQIQEIYAMARESFFGGQARSSSKPSRST